VPLKLEKSDRRLLMWAALIFVPLILALALVSSNESDSGVPSSYSAQPSGAKAAYLLLRDLGYNVHRWEQSPAGLPAAGGHTVLVLALPFRPPSPEEKNALQLYLTRGGRILATGYTADLYLPQADTQREPVPDPIAKQYQPQLVTSLTRGGAIEMSPSAYWKKRSIGGLAHYADDDRPIVVSYQVGKGQVIWWGASTPLSNAGISRSGNLALLLNSLGEPAHTQVFWDEYFHGSQRSVGAYMSEMPVLVGLLQGGLVGLAMLLTYSRRTGPVHPADSPSRLSPLEFVETLGGLYRQAHAIRAGLEVPYTRFRMRAARQLGLKNDVPAADLARALCHRLGCKDDNLQDLLLRIEAAMYDPELQEAQALELAQQLNAQARRLQLISFEQQEIVSHANSVPGTHSRTN
jgi:Domain of unknown function (DUF4350)